MRYGTVAGGLMAAVALLAGPGANAQIVAQGNGYLFRQKFTTGQKINYAMDISASTPGSAMGGSYKAQMLIHLSVLSAQNGVANVKVVSDGLTLNGKAMQKGESATIKMDARGQTVGGGSGHNGTIGPDLPAGAGQDRRDVYQRGGRGDGGGRI